MKIFINCKEAAKIVSQGLDAQLPLFQKITLRIHLMMCRGCTLYQKQLRALRNLFHDYNNKIEQEDFLPGEHNLTADSRSRIKTAVKKSLS